MKMLHKLFMTGGGRDVLEQVKLRVSHHVCVCRCAFARARERLCVSVYPVMDLIGW